MSFASLLLGLCLSTPFVSADPVKDAVALELAFIKRVFETGYAPAQWKKDHLGWDLNREYELSLKNLHALPAVTPHAYRRIVSSLLGSTRDYHVGSGFFTTERASLPFLVKGTKGRFFIVRVDDSKVDPKTFPFRAGDELITFGGETAAEAVRRVRESLTFASVDTTGQRLAERILTERSAQSALDVPQGPIDVEVKREEGGKTVHIRRQLQWEYHPEQIEWNLSELKFHAMASSNQPKFNWLRPQMLWGQWKGIPAVSSDHGSDPFEIGGRISYVPSLGPIVAEAQKSDTFHWYIYRHPKGHLVGYVRIPHYMGDNKVFADFKKIIARFEQATDALVIDQINNPGGSLFYVMALVSVLSDKPMSVPDQHIALFPSILNELHELEEQTKDVRTDADARKALKAELIDGYPVDLQLVQGIRTFAREVKTEWSARRRLTRPLNYMGVDKVNPDADVHYGKPILVLTNEMDFSGGDFFPAILQDNRRVKILGQRTSGAGGYVIPVEFPSGLGLSAFSFTGSLARRLNNDPIENLGVVPDTPYELTVRDLTEGFPDYRDAINSAVGTQIH